MQFRLIDVHLVKYGAQEDGKIWGKEKLKAMTPNLVGKVVKLPSGTLALVYKMWFDNVGLRVLAVPKEEVEKAMESKEIILPDGLESNN